MGSGATMLSPEERAVLREQLAPEPDDHLELLVVRAHGRLARFAAGFRDQTRLTVGEVSFDVESCRVIRDGA